MHLIGRAYPTSIWATWASLGSPTQQSTNGGLKGDYGLPAGSGEQGSCWQPAVSWDVPAVYPHRHSHVCRDRSARPSCRSSGRVPPPSMHPIAVHQSAGCLQNPSLCIQPISIPGPPLPPKGACTDPRPIPPTWQSRHGVPQRPAHDPYRGNRELPPKEIRRCMSVGSEGGWAAMQVPVEGRCPASWPGPCSRSFARRECLPL